MKPDRARAFLEHWLGEASDPDPEQQRWKRDYFDGAVLAYERVGVLTAPEAARWRDRFASPPKTGAGEQLSLRPAVQEHIDHYLSELVERMPTFSREPNPAGQLMWAQCTTALDALRAVGALGEDAYADWRRRVLKAQAPWLHEPIALPPDGTLYAINVPPADEKQAAEDAAHAAALSARPKASQITRVITGSPQRHDDLAIVAVVIHEDAVAVHFHYLGPPAQSHGSPEAGLDAFRSTIEKLQPPTLRDDQDTEYKPVDQRPAGSSGAGGIPDPNRRQAITGHWLYVPAPPEAVATFIVERGVHRWTVTSS